ncbi:MAG: hypothetical protein ACMZ7B_00555 [Balneola sp.]
MNYLTTLLALAIITVNTSSVLAQNEDFVQLRDSTVIKGKVEVQEKMFGKNTITIDDTLKYYLQEVHAYQIDNVYYLRMYGGYGDAFAKRIERGNIDLFTRTVRNSGGGVMFPMGSVGPVAFGPSFNPSSQAEYFSKDGGPILKANQSNLKRALSDNPTSMYFLKKRDGATAIQVVGIIGGIAITALSITSQADSEEFNPTGPLLGLGVIAGSAWIPYFKKQEFTRNAIRSYNHPDEFEGIGNTNN